MSLVLDGTKGIVFPSANTQSDAALITAGGTIAGNLTLGGNLTFNAGTNGITFNNTGALQNSSLNDYETGTWTAVMTPGTSGSFGTPYNNSGAYTKIGNMVYCYLWYRFNPANYSSPVGTILMSGLPFSPSTNWDGNYRGRGILTGYNWQSVSNASFAWILSGGSGTSGWTFGYGNNSYSAFTTMTATNVGNANGNSEFYMDFWYQTSF